MAVIFGPAGLGPVKTSAKILSQYNSHGLKACEIAFTYNCYIKPPETPLIIEKAKEEKKRKATKKRILQCCEIGELLEAKVVVFHPGYYTDNKEDSYQTIKKGVKEIMEEIKKRGWKKKKAPETMGKINVFGSMEEISWFAKETGCSFCIDFAHILARDKKIDYKKIENLFPQEEWHVHFSGIVYGEKGEKHHITTTKEAWKELLKNIPLKKNIRIINESPSMIDDSIEGLNIWKKMQF